MLETVHLLLDCYHRARSPAARVDPNARIRTRVCPENTILEIECTDVTISTYDALVRETNVVIKSTAIRPVSEFAFV